MSSITILDRAGPAGAEAVSGAPGRVRWARVVPAPGSGDTGRTTRARRSAPTGRSTRADRRTGIVRLGGAAQPVRAHQSPKVVCARPLRPEAYGPGVVPAAPAQGERAVAAVRLTHRGRAVVTAAAVAVATVVLVVLGTASIATTSASTGADVDASTATVTVTVEPGQSLWEIARSAAPDTDPRATITRIVDTNGLASAGAIRPGQRLTVPLAR